jgi:hypothetical protein
MTRGPRTAGCGGCSGFADDPGRLLAALPGLGSLSSPHASVRAGDGLCLRHGRVINGRAACADYAPG